MTLDKKTEDLGNPEIFEENRLAPVSDHRWYEREEDALADKGMELSASLSGMWKFFYAPNPEAAPLGFAEEQFSCAGWAEIPVPAQTELCGYGCPQYTDTDYPWDGKEKIKAYGVPSGDNPTGCYARQFTLPEQMREKRIQLHFEGVESAFHCWLNGKYVGYSEDSYTPAVFDVTELVREGKNKLAVEVYRFSTGTWLEDQDFWRMGGIIRDVRVTALPDIHMRDIDVSVDLTAPAGTDTTDMTGIADVRITMDGERTAGSLVRWKLFAPGGDLVVQGESPVEDDLPGQGETSFRITVPHVQMWSAEEPWLYRLVLAVTDTAGETVEAVPQRIGFRKVEIRDAVLMLNGKRLRINGVNRHEFSARKGRAIGREEMEWDIRFLKKYNFNAVRTSHYPNQSEWYELCDSYGIYVMDETNLETHGTWHLKKFDETLPGDNPKWREACLSRAEAMLERDKNHPCIFSWSVGNESWSGQTLYDMSQYFRRRDTTRPVHYENVCHDRRWSGTTDFESRMYVSPAESEEYLKNAPDKPYLLCEYSHAMGNSCGNLHEYTELSDKYPQYAGGFIWDYMDQSLVKKDPFGEEYFAYGGDFGDRPSNYNFCTDGLLYGDRNISPKMQEVKYLYQPYRLFPGDAGVRVESRMQFSKGEFLRLCWSLEKEGEVIRNGSMPFMTEPGGEAFFACNLSLPEEAGEYVRNASLILNRETAYGEEGWEMCFGQETVRVPAITFESGSTEENGEDIPEIIDGDSTFSVVCNTFSAQFQKRTGRLLSYKTGGKELVYDPLNTLLPNFWRAPTDNDEGNRMKERCAVWKTASMYPVLRETSQKFKGGRAEVRTVYGLAPGASCEVTFRVDADGILEIEEHFTGQPGLPEMPCFGMTWKLPRELEYVRWYGLGPEETYVDRQKGGRYGVFETTPQSEIPGYVVPQECGNHMGTRWLTLTDACGTGIRIESSEAFEFSALPYTCHELELARHLYELPRPYATVLRLNACQTGIGGDDSWGARAHENYIVQAAGEKYFRFRIMPVKTAKL